MNSIPGQIKNTTSHFNYSEKWVWLETTGKKLFGSDFRLRSEDSELILKLIAWSVGDKKLADHFKLDLSKGIFLKGPVGCGKTSLMTLLSIPLRGGKYGFRIKSCRQIGVEYAEDGPSILSRYSGYKENTVKHFCFDDLGVEKDSVYFGNYANVMEEILLSRYETYYTHKAITHITSNLTSRQLEQRYGIRVRSRCKILFNQISFNQNAIDKRSLT